jgi:flagellar biosynthesis protein FlhB
MKTNLFGSIQFGVVCASQDTLLWSTLIFISFCICYFEHFPWAEPRNQSEEPGQQCLEFIFENLKMRLAPWIRIILFRFAMMFRIFSSWTGFKNRPSVRFLGWNWGKVSHFRGISRTFSISAWFSRTFACLTPHLGKFVLNARLTQFSSFEHFAFTTLHLACVVMQGIALVFILFEFPFSTLLVAVLFRTSVCCWLSCLSFLFVFVLLARYVDSVARRFSGFYLLLFLCSCVSFCVCANKIFA